MRVFNTKLLLTGLLFALFNGLNAQETEEEKSATFKISGSVDTYFRYNFNENQQQAPATSFANQSGFALGMANIITSYEGNKSGFVADLVFGPRGNEAVFNSTEGSTPMVNQLYAYLHLSENLVLSLGNFNTFLGYEVIAPAANFNYSTSYLFSYGPFSHTGIKADFSLSENWSLMVGAFNPTDYTEFNPSDQYMLGAQLGFYDQYLNFLTGMGQTQIDFTGGFQLSEAFYLGVNASSYTSGDATGFSGVALYPQYNISEQFDLGIRFETFSDDSIVFSMPEVSTTAITLTGNYSSGNLSLKPELRLDKASETIFTGPQLKAQKQLAAFVLAAIYTF